MGLLDIVIVNWNSGNQLRECLYSIRNTNYQEIIDKIIIVDNASTDNSTQSLEQFELPIVLINNQKNYGFAHACNQGAKVGDAEFILFLNPDTRVYRNTLRDSINYMRRNEDIGILGIQLIDENNKISRTCARFPKASQFFVKSLGLEKRLINIVKPHKMIEWDHKESRIVDQVIGAFFLTRRDLFEKLKGFDTDYFVYFEEVDFSLRAKKLGYKSFYLANVQAFHKGGGTSEQVKAKRLYYSLQSRLIYSKKHFNILDRLLVYFTTLFIEPITRSIYTIARGSIRETKEVLKAYYFLYTYLLRIRKIGDN
jgi:N-acetylglucosaminyl-diphospho-decaprenol L-rhamnosyltransferase